MTPEAVFKAYDQLYAIPPHHVVNMRRALDNGRRRWAQAGGTTTTVSTWPIASSWSPQDEALAWLIDVTRHCWCLWPTGRTVH